MKLLITGGAGFLGKVVVDEAVRRGHAIRAIVRKPRSSESVEYVVGDLRSRAGLTEIVRGCDAVIHLAAAKSGDLYAQLGGTVVATENLLAAMTDVGVKRIVLVSSFSVYEYLHHPPGTVLDESSPLDEAMTDRDDYAVTKLVQEKLVRERADLQWTVLRPGTVYGPGSLFNARVGMAAGSTWVRTGGEAKIPLTYVENCADAIVQAVETDAAIGQVLNVVDDDPPTQREYVALLQKHTTSRPRVVPIPWAVIRFVGWLATVFNRRVLGGRAKVPGLLSPARMHARCKPLEFPNRRIKAVLGWTPRVGLAEGVAKSRRSEAG